MPTTSAPQIQIYEVLDSLARLVAEKLGHPQSQESSANLETAKKDERTTADASKLPNPVHVEHPTHMSGATMTQNLGEDQVQAAWSVTNISPEKYMEEDRQRQMILNR